MSGFSIMEVKLLDILYIYKTCIKNWLSQSLDVGQECVYITTNDLESDQSHFKM